MTTYASRSKITCQHALYHKQDVYKLKQSSHLREFEKVNLRVFVMALLHKDLKGGSPLNEPNLSGNLGIRAT